MKSARKERRAEGHGVEVRRARRMLEEPRRVIGDGAERKQHRGLNLAY
jgi:hypothetical protein